MIICNLSGPEGRRPCRGERARQPTNDNHAGGNDGQTLYALFPTICLLIRGAAFVPCDLLLPIRVRSPSPSTDTFPIFSNSRRSCHRYLAAATAGSCRPAPCGINRQCSPAGSGHATTWSFLSERKVCACSDAQRPITVVHALALSN